MGFSFLVSPVSLYVLAIVLIAAVLINGNPRFCEMNCGHINHTACTANTSRCEGKVKGCVEINSNYNFRRWIMKGHNRLRNRIANGSLQVLNQERHILNMRAFSYSLQLEYIALCWALNCTRGNDLCRNIVGKDQKGKRQEQKISQSIAIVKSENMTRKGIFAIVENWFTEIDEFAELNPEIAGNEIKKYSGDYMDFISNFENVVHPNIRFIGCARATKRKVIFLVCNYYPAPDHGAPLIWDDKQTNCTKMLRHNRLFEFLCGPSKLSHNAYRRGTYLAAPNVQSSPLFLALLILCSLLFG